MICNGLQSFTHSMKIYPFKNEVVFRAIAHIYNEEPIQAANSTHNARLPITCEKLKVAGKHNNKQR